MIRPSFSLLSCRKMKINLRQTKNHSAENDFSFGAEKNSVMPKAMPASLRSRAETWLKDVRMRVQPITILL